MATGISCIFANQFWGVEMQNSFRGLSRMHLLHLLVSDDLFAFVHMELGHQL